MNNYHVTTTNGDVFFKGAYRRDLETNNWHYYEREDGTLMHFRKDAMVWVSGDVAKSLEN